MTQPYFIYSISHTEIKSQNLAHLEAKSHRIFRPFYIKYCEEININHTLLCLSKASYI